MKIANVFQLGLKELRGILRDPMMIILIAYSFTFSVYTAANSTPETLNKASVAIVDEDQSPVSGRISTAFLSPFFNKPEVIALGEMDRRTDEGRDTFALDIPPNFQRDLLAGRSPTIQLNVDATRMSQAFTGNGYIQSIIGSEISEYLQRYRSASAGLPVEIVARARFNQELNKSWFGAITNVVSSITMLSIVLTGAALIREREHGTVEHLLVMPVTPAEIMTGKVWSMGLIVLLASAFSFAVVVQGVMGVPVEGSMMLFLAGTALHLLATTSLGIFLATIAGSMPQFGLLLMLTLLPLEALSGGMTPRESMPEVVQTIMLAAPNTHFIMLAQSVLFRGAGLDVVWPQFLSLLVIGSILFVFALGRFRAFLR